jgi:ActR/RegA family two-component response regulator
VRLDAYGMAFVSNVAIIDDNLGFRERLETFVREQNGCSIAGLAGDTKSGLSLVDNTRPDFVLIDIGLPGESGLHLARLLADLDLGTRIVLMGENETVEYERAAIDAGAEAYISKTEISQVLPDLLRPPADLNRWRPISAPAMRDDTIAQATTVTGTFGAAIALTLPRPRYAGWEAILSAATLVSGITLNQPAYALVGMLGFAFLSYRQMTLPRLRGGHLGERELHRTRVR